MRKPATTTDYGLADIFRNAAEGMLDKNYSIMCIYDEPFPMEQTRFAMDLFHLYFDGPMRAIDAPLALLFMAAMVEEPEETYYIVQWKDPLPGYEDMWFDLDDSSSTEEGGDEYPATQFPTRQEAFNEGTMSCKDVDWRIVRVEQTVIETFDQQFLDK